MLSTVKNIIKDKKKGIDFLKTKYADFLAQYPTLFEFITTESHFDLSQLEHMLDLKTQMENGSLSTFEAEKNIGEQLAERYLYTDFQRPTEEQKRLAYNKLMKK
jgi:hypothetical protein